MRLSLPNGLRGLAGRVFVGTALIVGAVLAATLAVTTSALRRADDAAVRRRVEQDADLVAHLLAGRERSLAGGARVFVQDAYVHALVAKGDAEHEDVLDRTFEAVDLLDASWVFLTDAHGRLLAKSDEPAAVNVDMGGVPLIAGALRGQVTSGFGVSRDSLLFQAVAVPIVVGSSAPVGVLVATQVVSEDVVRDVKATTGSEVLFYALDAEGRPHVAAASLPRTRALDSVVAAIGGRQARSRVLKLGGASYLMQGATATTSGGDAVGGWTVLRPHDDEAPGIAGIRQSLAVAALVGLALALGAAWLAARRVTRPIRALADAARRAADGDYDPARGEYGIDGDASDEIAALGAAFHAMLADLRDREALTELAPAFAAGRVPNDAETAVHAAAPAAAPPRPTTRGVLRLDPRVDPRAAPAADSAPRHARLADRYELQAVVGAGGTGIVYRALDHTLGETVAVKMLRPELLAADPLARERLTHEIRLARRISHRHVVRIHDFAESDGVPFLTMEYVDGPSLETVLRARGPLPPRAALAVAKQLARALDVAHTQGVVHGDLKPANLLAGAGGVLKVSDFGVARLMRAAPAKAGGADAARIVGAVVGTPEYMAPELLLGGVPDVRGDIYAAGVVLHECLTGETPFHADTPVAFFAHKLDDATPPPQPPRPSLAVPRAGLAAALAALVPRMTAADPAERPASARALYALLAALG
ncbi:MAG: protein kinase [Gemmatirosa sp.]|nr:protein kinase [Gemmatirosa sp.]